MQSDQPKITVRFVSFTCFPGQTERHYNTVDHKNQDVIEEDSEEYFNGLDSDEESIEEYVRVGDGDPDESELSIG